jgi:hypothetical protein
MAICKSLLKYGYSGFYLEILEYCDSSELLTREKHFMDLLKPNIIFQQNQVIRF